MNEYMGATSVNMGESTGGISPYIQEQQTQTKLHISAIDVELSLPFKMPTSYF
jgi:hypothetical protein